MGISTANKQTTYNAEAVLDLPPAIVAVLYLFAEQVIVYHCSIGWCRIQQPHTWCVNTQQ